MSHGNESCHLWMSHVTWEWVMSQMHATCHVNELVMPQIWVSSIWRVMSRVNESCHMGMCHVTDECVMLHKNKPCHRFERVTCECVMSHVNELCHIWMSHVTYKCVMSHINESHRIWMSHVGMCRVTYEWVMSHTNESCHIRTSHVAYKWVILRMNTSCHTNYATDFYESHHTLTRLRRDKFHKKWKVNGQVASQPKPLCVWHDPFMCVTWLIHVCDVIDVYENRVFTFQSCYTMERWCTWCDVYRGDQKSPIKETTFCKRDLSF